MSLIEGIGDEVLQFLLAVLLVLLGLAAWWSTQIADTPLVRTVLILERRTRRRLASLQRGQIEPSPPAETTAATPVPVSPINTEEDQPDTGQVDESPSTEGEASSPDTPPKSEDDPQDSTQQEQDTPEQDSPNIRLRKNRLSYLENRNKVPEPTESAPEDAEMDVEDEEETAGPDNIRIRLKYLNDEQKLVEGRLQEPLGDFRRRHFSLELEGNKLVRLIFNGQVLARDTASLQEHGLFDNCVVHCLVHQPRVTAPTPASADSHAVPPPLHTSHHPLNRDPLHHPRGQEGGADRRDWDLGSVVFMFLSVALGLAWYGRCVYSQYFSTTASVALVGLTGVFVVSVVGLMLPDHDGLRQ